MKFEEFEIQQSHHDWGLSPAYWGIRCTKETDQDDEYLKQIIIHYRDRGVWAISNLIYFDSDKERTLFYLGCPKYEH